jgi:hypothetical protein
LAGERDSERERKRERKIERERERERLCIYNCSSLDGHIGSTRRVARLLLDGYHFTTKKTCYFPLDFNQK